MKYWSKCFALLMFTFCATSLFAQQSVPPPAAAFATAPEISYDSAPNFLKLPEGLYMGEAMGVATNSKGYIFVYTRSGEATRLFEFDPEGNFVREIGKGLYPDSSTPCIPLPPMPRATCTLVTGKTNESRYSITTASSRPCFSTSELPGPSAFRQEHTNIFTPRIQMALRTWITVKSIRWNWTERSWEHSALRGSN